MTSDPISCLSIHCAGASDACSLWNLLHYVTCGTLEEWVALVQFPPASNVMPKSDQLLPFNLATEITV